MFIIKPPTKEDYIFAIKILCDYAVDFHTIFKKDNIRITVNGEHDEDMFRLCEVAMMIYFFKDPVPVCDCCKELFNHKKCKHLTFTKYKGK